MRKTQLLSVLMKVTIVFLGLALLLLPFKYFSEQSVAVDFIKAMLWPYAIIAIVFLLRVDVSALRVILLDRLKKGAPIELGLLKLGEIQNNILVPGKDERITAASVALLHTSWYSEKGTANLSKSFAPGRYYRFDVIVFAPETVLDRIDYVTYFLQPAFPASRAVQSSADRKRKFILSDSANGYFILRAELHFGDQDDVVTLNRFIDLHERGPRVQELIEMGPP